MAYRKVWGAWMEWWRDVVVDYRERDYPKPGVDPQFFSVPAPVSTAGLRIAVTQPAANATWWRASHVVSFSELYAFVGPKNVALNAKVAATSSNEFGYLWSTKCLTDGFAFFNPLFHHVEDPENNIIGHGLKKLEISYSAVALYTSNIYEKLQVPNVAAAVATAIRKGLI